uniref:tRNA-t(6)A37 methylthiotransferase n=1 Tax=Meloidogyne incognita TaxID=6306 RepID=A0A914LNI9_MELIC
MLDIEDSIERVPLSQNNQNGLVKNKFESFFNIKTRRKQKDDVEEEKQMAKNELESVLPWNRVVYLRTWGCSHNNSDSEYMAGLLLKAGFKVTSEKELADIWLLNSCTVKTPSETMLENQVKEGKSKMKRIVVAGCVPQAGPQISWLKDVSVIGVQQIDKIVNVVEETLNGNSVRFLSRQNKSAKAMDLTLPKMRRNEFIEILAINSGCLNHCTYCKTKAARGDLKSFPLNALVDQARRALTEQGCRELWLTSEDLGAWGRDFGMVIPDLLQALVEIIPDGCMMRMGMTNPPYILDHLEEIAQILNHPKVYSFLHIPVQSGSNAVLSDMKREYTKEHFCQIVDYMIKK